MSLKIQDREDWLNRAAHALVMIVLDSQVPRSAPKLATTRITCGFPRGARKGRSQTMRRELSTDGTSEVFISPEMDNPEQVLRVLTVQLIQSAHNAAGWSKGAIALHDAKRIGLHGPSAAFTSDDAGRHLQATFTMIADKLGAYPHARVMPGAKQGTRLLKVSCHDKDCGAIFRTSAKWLESVTCCPCCQGSNIRKDAGAGE